MDYKLPANSVFIIKLAFKCLAVAVGIYLMVRLWFFWQTLASPGYDCSDKEGQLDQLLLCEIGGKMNHFAAVQPVDFWSAQLVIWLGIGGSMIAAILAAANKSNGSGYRWAIALTAAIPVATATISSQINFEARNRWDTYYYAFLEELYRELAGGVAPGTVSADLGKLTYCMESQFPYSPAKWSVKPPRKPQVPKSQEFEFDSLDDCKPVDRLAAFVPQAAAKADAPAASGGTTGVH